MSRKVESAEELWKKIKKAVNKQVSSTVSNLKEEMDSDEEKKVTVMSALAHIGIQVHVHNYAASSVQANSSVALEKLSQIMGKAE